MNKQQSLIRAILIICVSWHSIGHAMCTNVLEGLKNSLNPTHRDNAVLLDFGTILARNFGNSPPHGTLLQSITVNHTAFAHRTYSPEDPVWECDIDDKNNIHLLVATRSQSPRHGGALAIVTGGNDGTFFYTRIKGIALKLEMGGIYFKQSWQKVELIHKDEIATNSSKPNKFFIKLKNIPPVTASLYKTRRVNGTGNDGCDSNMATTDDIGDPKLECAYPNGYVQLAGFAGAPNIKAKTNPSLTGSNGDDKYITGGNGFGYTLRGNRVYETPTCYPIDKDPTDVSFKPLFFDKLQQATSNQVFETKPFKVEIACDNNGGNFPNNTRITLQMSRGTANALTGLSLLNNNTSDYLVSDSYNDPLMAQGVGIRVRYGEQYLQFIADPNLKANESPHATNGFVAISNPQKGEFTENGQQIKYIVNFDAQLVKLPTPAGDDARAGKIHATATVVLRVL